MEKKGRKQEMFAVSNTPVADRSFLPKKAADMCKGVSVYWAYRSCQAQLIDQPDQTGDRQRRTLYSISSYNGLPGLGGCCEAFWACQVRMTETIQGSLHTCTVYATYGTCCGSVAYPYCSNVYQAHWNTPNLAC